MDDQLWYESIRLYHHQSNAAVNAINFHEDEKVLRMLMARGVVDHADFDKPWAASTRAMRYSAVMMDRMLTMFQEEQKRVRKYSFVRI